MALSDYDHLSFGPTGKPANGVFVGLNDYVFRLYKRWLYVDNARLWQEGSSSFVSPVVMQINNGDLSFGGNRVVAVPAQTVSGILIYIESYDYRDGNPVTTRFAGVACSGYDYKRVTRNACAALKLNPADWELSSTGSCGDDRDITLSRVRGKESDKTLKYSFRDKKAMRRYETRYVGVTKAAVNELLGFLAREIGWYDKEGQKWLTKVRRAKALRYNQGDAYFASHLGNKLCGTKPSKAQTPLLIRALTGKSKKT
jgi:hypothetical protein